MCGLGLNFSQLSVKVIGPRIGGGGPLVDGDGDGRCQEEDGRWVPCPPGVNSGSVLLSVVNRTAFDLPQGGGIDKAKAIHPKFREAAKKRMEILGLSRRGLRNETKKALAEASKDLIEQAKNWYPNVHEKTREMVDAINEKHGSKIGFEQAAAVIAGLSPAREFGKNVRDAKKLLLVHAQDSEFKILPEAIDGLRGENKTKLEGLLKRLDGRDPKPSDFNKEELALLVGLHPTLSKLGNSTGLVNVVRSYSIFRGVPVEDAMSGPKMRSFYSNIVNPEGDRATIDTWMYRVMVSSKHKFTVGSLTGTIPELEAAGKRVQDIFQGTPGGIKGTDIPSNVGLYPEFAEALRDVAREHNLPVAALQAILWEVARTRAGYKPTQWEKIAGEFAV